MLTIHDMRPLLVWMPPALREVLTASRTLKGGGGAAGVATVRGRRVEVAQQALTETQGTVLPLVPHH